MQMAVVVNLVIIAVLFALGVAITYERPRAWLSPGPVTWPHATNVLSTRSPGSRSTPSSG